MSVTQGFEAFASEYNALRVKVNKWFADNYNTVSFGDVGQTYGWGGVEVASVSEDTDMLASQMNSLIDRCNIGVTACNNVSIALSQLVADSSDILAADYNDTESKSDLINTNRFDIDSVELSLHVGDSEVRTTSYNTAIDCTFRYTFLDFNDARYFWNSSGALNISGNITAYTSGVLGYDGEGVNEILTSMGTVTMDYSQTIQSGSGGLTTSIGYYDLTTSYQTIFTQTGTGAYSDCTLGIEARRDSTGLYIEVRVTITPESGHTVDGITTITSQYRQLDNQLSGAASLIIPDPAPTVVDTLE